MVDRAETFCKLRRYRGLVSVENVGRTSLAYQALERLTTNAARSGGSEVAGGSVSPLASAAR